MWNLQVSWIDWWIPLVKSWLGYWMNLHQLRNARLALNLSSPDLMRRQRHLKGRCRNWEKSGLNISWSNGWLPTKRYKTLILGYLTKRRKQPSGTKSKYCQQDSKKLHTLVTNLTTKPQEESCPKDNSKVHLAKEFADFFEQKIQKSETCLMISQSTHQLKMMHQD